MVAHVVSTSGEWRRRTGAANAVYVAQHRAAARVSALPIGEPRQLDPDAGRDDQHDPDERQDRAGELERVERVGAGERRRGPR